MKNGYTELHARAAGVGQHSHRSPFRRGTPGQGARPIEHLFAGIGADNPGAAEGSIESALAPR